MNRIKETAAARHDLRGRRPSRNPEAGKTGRSRRWGWILVPVLVSASLGGAAQGSIPEDPDNLHQWVARYNGSGQATSLAVSPDDSTVFVTGTSSGDYATIAYSTATGTQLWVARYNGPGNAYDFASSIAVSPDGSKVFVTGRSVGAGWYDYATVAYSTATGTQLWVAGYNGPGNSTDYASSIAVSPDGSKVFVTGSSVGVGSAEDYATVAYSTATGTQLWAVRYNGPLNSSDVASSLVVSPDGSKVFVTGSSFGSGYSYDYATLAYSAATGAELWATRYETLEYDRASSLAVSPDGSTVFVTGTSYGLVNRWVTRWHYDYATLAYSAATGTQHWAALYNGPANSRDEARTIAVSPDGSKVFVTGISGASDNSWDYATLAYSAAAGAQLWAARYNNGPADSAGASFLAVSPDGSKVFVTGTSAGYVTLAYSTATMCANGSDETGPASNLVNQVEPLAGPTSAPYVHGVNCDVVAGNGL